jgi:YD repeat-containing protein
MESDEKKILTQIQGILSEMRHATRWKYDSLSRRLEQLENLYIEKKEYQCSKTQPGQQETP